MAHKRWIAACDSAEVRVMNLGRTLRQLRTQFLQNEVGPADYFRKLSERIDRESAILDRLFLDNQPPLEGHMDARIHYRARQDRIRETIREITLTL